GDYNHIFDPQAKLSGFFENPDEQTAILVDEAHNLPSRATTMYSAGISGQKFIQVRKILKNPSLNFIHAYSQLINNLELTINEFNEFSKIFQLTSKPKSNNFFTEKNNQWLIDQNFIGIKQKPDLLLKKINNLVFQIRDFLDEQRLFEGRRQLLDFWFDLLFFTRVADFYFDQAYITAFRIDKNGFLNSYLLALDASKYITESYLNKHPTIFFSATLSPIHYYHSLLNSESREQPAETLQLSSPFPSENRLLAALTKFSVKFKDRQETMPAIINFIYQACLKKTGNYLIFVPSYQYLFQLEKIVKKQPSDKDVDLMFQNRNMNQFQKDRFIQRFDSFGRKTLLAFAVLGSHFNEGIDLQGENLSGVFVIGTGLPQISPEREIMTQYYSEKYNAGRAYGYQYPGFNRVQQAVGRLIRSEKDIGFAILIDDRYLNPEWQEIFPNDWLVGIFEEDEDLLAEIEIFWQDH
ncbi:MAG TPA: helicase C-terminal domain-containing protein, partial [Candidatus Eisenbacteria bacterium]|nr:helicase C-terminal domain-containing protein [Candidatus Eisenbacteria bacterium]